MARDTGIYFKVDDICKSLICTYGFVPYRRRDEED